LSTAQVETLLPPEQKVPAGAQAGAPLQTQLALAPDAAHVARGPQAASAPQTEQPEGPTTQVRTPPPGPHCLLPSAHAGVQDPSDEASPASVVASAEPSLPALPSGLSAVPASLPAAPPALPLPPCPAEPPEPPAPAPPPPSSAAVRWSSPQPTSARAASSDTASGTDANTERIERVMREAPCGGQSSWISLVIGG